MPKMLEKPHTFFLKQKRSYSYYLPTPIILAKWKNQSERNLKHQHQRQPNSVSTTKDGYDVIRAVKVPQNTSFIHNTLVNSFLVSFPSVFNLGLKVKATCPLTGLKKTCSNLLCLERAPNQKLGV